MSEPRYLRTLAVPLGIALIFLVFTPKLCERAIITAKQRKPIVAVVTQSGPPGLRIQSSTPAPNEQQKELHFPPGLDVNRIQYLVEINQSFAAPMTMTVTEKAPITQVVLEDHYFEKTPTGGFAPTRDGLINVNGAVESPAGWIVPVGHRKFVKVDGIDDTGGGRYDVWIVWRWEPNAIGAKLIGKPDLHHLKAEFAGGPSWVLDRFLTEPDHEFR